MKVANTQINNFRDSTKWLYYCYSTIDFQAFYQQNTDKIGWLPDYSCQIFNWNINHRETNISCKSSHFDVLFQCILVLHGRQIKFLPFNKCSNYIAHEMHDVRNGLKVFNQFTLIEPNFNFLAISLFPTHMHNTNIL